MKILAISDERAAALWDYFDNTRLEGIDLILSCGDLPPTYLSFLATFTKAPVLYVHGNHDGCYEEHPPEGCICIEDQIYTYNGLRILGLGGSMRYKNGPHQYSQREMSLRICKLWGKLVWKRGFDILLTHSPAYGFNDGEDLPHMGFKSFNLLIEKYQPKYFIHGHVHLNYTPGQKRVSMLGNTQVINAFERYVFEVNIPTPSR